MINKIIINILLIFLCQIIYYLYKLKNILMIFK